MHMETLAQGKKVNLHLVTQWCKDVQYSISPHIHLVYTGEMEKYTYLHQCVTLGIFTLLPCVDLPPFSDTSSISIDYHTHQLCSYNLPQQVDEEQPPKSDSKALSSEHSHSHSSTSTDLTLIPGSLHKSTADNRTSTLTNNHTHHPLVLSAHLQAMQSSL